MGSPPKSVVDAWVSGASLHYKNKQTKTMKKLTTVQTGSINGGGITLNLKKLTSVETVTVNGGGLNFN